MTTEERRALLDRAITAYGAPAQMDMAVEEMAELTKALCKIKRAQAGCEVTAAIGNVVEEMADVQIMLDQLRIIFHRSTEEAEEAKLERLKNRLDGETTGKTPASTSGSRSNSQQEVTAMNKATCRGCGAPIVWIKTPAGKAMPCDPAPVYYKAAPGGKDKIVTTRGEVVSCEIVPGGEATDAGYRPHWATCPQAGQFKRGGRARE